MAAIDDPRTLGRARLSFAREAEIDEFVTVLEKFERGDITPDEWRGYRLVRGTYGQRQPGDVHMLRVKIPQGVLDAEQLRALADVGERYSRGFGHITTRQNIQFHFVRLHDVELAMRRLEGAGLTTREACGNSVRNITACPYAGVAADEVFDVTPYAEALTRYLLRHPLSSSLPRKFKIAFEGCASGNHGLTFINDIGWRAVLRQDGDRVERGFRVTAGGGTSTMTRSGAVLCEFLPAGEMFNVAEAIVRVFHRLGDREHKLRNRMKFLINAMGWDAWSAEVGRALEGVRAEGGAALPFDPEQPPVENPPDWERQTPPSVGEVITRARVSTARGPGILPEVTPTLPVMNGDFGAWRGTNVQRQKQFGYACVLATVPMGDLTSAQLRILADLALAYGDGTVRTTPDQDLIFRWVRARDVAELYRRLAAAGLGLPGAGTLADVVSCPGAESCRLAVTQSRGLGRLLEDYLRARPELADAAREARIKISGCPNGCGQHHIATIGFQGSVRKLGDRAVPHYFVMIGGGVDDDGASFAKLVAKVPVRRTPEAVARLIALYQRERAPGESAQVFFQRIDPERARAALLDLERLTPEDAVPLDFVDLGEEQEFRPEILDGECAV